MKKSPEPQFTPEQELLLWSIRVDHAKDQRISEILTGGVDWTYVRETAIQHGIIPLLYKRLKEDMIDLVPPDELAELRTLFMVNAVRNLRMTQELIKVLDLLAEAGVEAMPFKGPALAVQAYGDLSMRSFCDLDILIHERDFDRMHKTLSEREFIPQNILDTEVKKKLTILEKDLTFYGHGNSIEIHWHITEPLLSIPIDSGELLIRAIPISLNGKGVKTLSLEDSIIVLCIHGTKHFWHELKWLADLTNLILNNPDINWQLVIRRAELVGVRRIIDTSFFLAQTQCGLKFTSANKNLFNLDTKIPHLARNIESNFFHPPNTSLFSVPPVFFLKSRERIGDQLTYIRKLFTNRLFIPDSFDFKFILLPEYLYPLYLFVRPFRLTMGYIQSVIH
jgi:hypothetical protein